METLYDLLGALAKDDADELRAAFRRAVKGAHPDLHPDDPDAAWKFRRIVRANEILGDAEQRAAYDHLLELARREQRELARKAVAARLYKLATGAMALTAVAAVALGGSALFLQLSAHGIAPASRHDIAAAEPAAIVAGLPDRPAGAPDASAPAELFALAVAPGTEATPVDPPAAFLGPPLDLSPPREQSPRAPIHAAQRGTSPNQHAVDQTDRPHPRAALSRSRGETLFEHLRKFERAFAQIGREARTPAHGPAVAGTKHLRHTAETDAVRRQRPTSTARP
jgi:curved DNA-binding protein CbpA